MPRPPLVALLFALMLAALVRPAHADPPTAGWEHRDYHGLSLEGSVAPIAGAILGGERYAGVSLGSGARYVLYSQSGTSFSKELSETVLGNHFGLDLSGYALRGEGDWSWMLGVDAALRNVVGESTAGARLQLSSLADLLLPEVGYAVGGSLGDRWFLGWHLKADYLFTNRLAVSGRAGMQIFYGDPDRALVSVSLGATLR